MEKHYKFWVAKVQVINGITHKSLIRSKDGPLDFRSMDQAARFILMLNQVTRPGVTYELNPGPNEPK